MKLFLRILSYILVATIASVVTLFLAPREIVTRVDSKLEAIQNLIDQVYIGEADKTAMEDAAADALNAATDDLCEYFTVDDLMFLNRTGRLSGAGAMVGTMLGIKPILRGDEEGHIVTYQKIRGRKKAVDALVKIYEDRVVDAANQRVGITHGDCPEEAKLLAERICAVAKPRELLVCAHEPFTGSHVGPGMLAVFFFGKGR